MKKTLVLAASFSAMSLLAGCASTGAPSVPVGDRSYSSDNSRAYNLAQAAGLHEARDTELGEDQYNSMMGDLSGGARTALSLSSSAGFGLSGGTSLGLGLATALLSGPARMEIDTAFAFVPSNEAASSEDAVEVIRQHFANAAETVASENGFIADITEERKSVRLSRQRNLMVYGLVNEDIGCMAETDTTSTKDYCTLTLGTPHASKSLRETPMAVSSIAGNLSYPFSSEDRLSSLRVWLTLSDAFKESLGEDHDAYRLKLLAEISSQMPSWFFIYEASKEKTPPLVLENGEIELFVTKN